VGEGVTMMILFLSFLLSVSTFFDVNFLYSLNAFTTTNIGQAFVDYKGSEHVRASLAKKMSEFGKREREKS
jgi:hypothetical protein